MLLFIHRIFNIVSFLFVYLNLFNKFYFHHILVEISDLKCESRFFFLFNLIIKNKIIESRFSIKLNNTLFDYTKSGKGKRLFRDFLLEGI